MDQRDWENSELREVNAVISHTGESVRGQYPAKDMKWMQVLHSLYCTVDKPEGFEVRQPIR